MILSMRRYESAASSPPIATTWSHAAVNGAPRSASEAIATVATPSRCAVRAIRATISPRLAISTDANIAADQCRDGSVCMYLAMMPSMTSSAPPAIEPRRPSR